jgi:threonyl-tRNA synthetase
VTLAEVAQRHRAGLAEAALAGPGPTTSWSTCRPSNRARRPRLAIVTDRDADGRRRHPPLDPPTCSAYAVQELFPEAQVTIGPVIENGFY